jgi:hypothetical protein
MSVTDDEIRSFSEAFTRERISAVLRDAFDPDAEAVALCQAEARKAWADGRQLTDGAFYLHRNEAWTRRIIKLNGPDIHWVDKFGLSVCRRASFLVSVKGPL